MSGCKLTYTPVSTAYPQLWRSPSHQYRARTSYTTSQHFTFQTLGGPGPPSLTHFAAKETEAVTPRLSFPTSNINARSLQPARRSQVPGSRSRVPRGTDLSERPGARDLAPGSHRLGALGPSQPRSGRVRSTAMAPVGRKETNGRRRGGSAEAWGLKIPSPARLRLVHRTDLDQRPRLTVRNLTGERHPVRPASSPRVPPPAAPGGRGCTSGPRLKGEVGGQRRAWGGGACAVRPSRR